MAVCIKAIGGEGPYNIIIGGQSKFHIDDIKNKLDIHKRIKNDKFILKTINEIIQLPEYIEDKNLLIQVLDGIWKMSNEKIFRGIVKSLELDEPINIAKKNLFWKWKELIESTIISYLKQSFDIKSLLKEWSAYVAEKNIDTSSIVLWCIFNTNSPWHGKYLVDINQFEYIGYCPAVPDERIKAIMKFPIDKLFVNIEPDIVKNIANINKQLSNSMDTIIVSDKISHIQREKFNGDLEEIMNIWVNFNIMLQPYLEEQEKYAIRVAQDIDKVANEINEINQKLVKQIGGYRRQNI